MIRFLYLAFVLGIGLTAIGQSITIKGIEKDVPDLSASVGLDTYAPDGINWPIIKFRTMEKGFQIDAGTVPPKVVYKIGEVWIYVQPRTRFLTVAHEKFGKSNTLHITPPCESSTVYQLDVEMIAADGKNANVISDGYCVVRVEPKDAAVYINGQLLIPVSGEVQKRLQYGKHKIKVERDMYYSDSLQIVVDENIKPIDIKLMPKFGWINITTVPEDGANVLINNKLQPSKTPFKTAPLPSGSYTVVVSKDMYETTSKEVTVKDNETMELQITMVANFGDTKITATEGADIYIDGRRAGVTNWNGRLADGVYVVKVEKDRHRSESRSIKITKNVPQTIDFKLEPIVGTLDIMCVPAGADISINGLSYGTAPKIINNLLIGEYDVVLSKPGFGTKRHRVIIEDGVTSLISEELATGIDITISSKPSGVDLYVDGNKVGVTPKTMPLSFGNHTIKLDNNGKKQITESINVVENGKNSFDFNVNYSRNIAFKSSPKSLVYINGSYGGQTPFDTKLDYGNYDLKFSNRTGTYNKSLTVNDNTDSEVSYKFKKTRYYSSEVYKNFIMYGVSAPIADKFMLSSYLDVSFGSVNKLGWYLRIKSSFTSLTSSYSYNDGQMTLGQLPNAQYEMSGKSKIGRLGGDLGLVVRLANPACVYMGVGYGSANYLVGMTETANGVSNDIWAKHEGKSVEGIEGDLGLMFQIGRFGLSVGATTVAFKYYEAGVGIGVWF